MRREEKPPKQLPAARECGPAVWSSPSLAEVASIS